MIRIRLYFLINIVEKFLVHILKIKVPKPKKYEQKKYDFRSVVHNQESSDVQNYIRNDETYNK